MKQTAVELFFNELCNLGFIEDPNDPLLQHRLHEAKEMQKQQIIETARFYFHERGKATPEQYYNKEYGGEK